MDVVYARGEDHRLSREEFVQSILEKSKNNNKLYKIGVTDEETMHIDYVPNKSAADSQFEQALATPPPLPPQRKAIVDDAPPRVPSPSQTATHSSSAVYPKDSMTGIILSPSWAQADRLEQVHMSENIEDFEGNDAAVSEDTVIERLRSHIASLELQLFNVIEYNQKVTIEEAAQVDIFKALMERQKAGHETTHQALEASLKQNKWLHNALEERIRRGGGSNSGTPTKEDNDDDTLRDHEVKHVDADDDISWKDRHSSGASDVSSLAAPAAEAPPLLPPSLDPSLRLLERLQDRLESVLRQFTSVRTSHASHQQQLTSNHHFYSNALKLKTAELQGLTESRNEASQSAKEAWAAVEKVKEALEKERKQNHVLTTSSLRLKDAITSLTERQAELVEEVNGKQRTIAQLEAEKVSLVAAHEKEARDVKIFHNQQCDHLYAQLASAKEEVEKRRAECAAIGQDLQTARKDKEEHLVQRAEEMERFKQLHEEEKSRLMKEKEDEHAQQMQERVARHAEELQAVHVTHATAAAKAIAAATAVDHQSRGSLQELAASSSTETAGESEVHEENNSKSSVDGELIAALDAAHKRANEAEKVAESLRISGKAREGKLLDRYKALTDRYNDLLLRSEDQLTQLKTKEEEVSHAHDLISQATAALSELKGKVSQHDEITDLNRSLSESLQFLKEEHSKVRSDLSIHSTELSASKAREQAYATKISQMDAASPRKILDRNKQQLDKMQKSIDVLEGEKMDLLQMVELLNEEKHHRDEDYSREHLESAARISELNTSVEELIQKKMDLQDKVNGLELRATQGREAQTKLIDLTGRLGDLEALLKHRESACRKLEAEIGELKLEKSKAAEEVDSLEANLRAAEERYSQASSQVKALSLSKQQADKETQNLAEAHGQVLDEINAKHAKFMAEKTSNHDRELRQIQDEHERVVASLEARLAATGRKNEDMEAKYAHESEMVLKKAEHRQATELERQAQRYEASLEDLKVQHITEQEDLKARHSRLLEVVRNEAAEEIKALELEKSKMKAALETFREESKGETKLLEMKSSTIASLHNQLETLKGEIEAVQARYEGQQRVIDKMKVELTSDNEKLHNNDVELRNLRKSCKEGKAREAALTATQERLQQTIEEQERAMAVLRADARRMEISKQSLRSSTEQLSTELENVTLRLSQQKDQYEALNEEHKLQMERLELENATLLSMVNETKAALAIDEARLKNIDDERRNADIERERRTSAAIAAAAAPLMSPQSASSSTYSTPSQSELASHASPAGSIGSFSTSPVTHDTNDSLDSRMNSGSGAPVVRAKETAEDVAFRGRLSFIYSRYAPGKLATIPSIMEMYQGVDGRNHLFTSLRRKYLTGYNASDDLVPVEDEENYSDDENEAAQKRERRVRARQIHVAFDPHLSHEEAMKIITSLEHPEHSAHGLSGTQAPAPAPAPAHKDAPAPIHTNVSHAIENKQQSSPTAQSPHSTSHLQQMIQAKQVRFDPHNPHAYLSEASHRSSMVSPKPPSGHAESPYDRNRIEDFDDKYDEDDSEDSFAEVSAKMNSLVGL